MPTLTDFDRQLLDLLQRAVPLVPRPWDALAATVGIEPGALRARVTQLRGGDEPVIREIAAVFEPSALGYATALVAAAVVDERLDEAGAIVADHPGVSHCYGRSGELNLWFTLSLGPDSRLGLQGTAERLAAMIGTGRCHLLPTARRYKIGVHVGADGGMGSTATHRPAPPPRALGGDERRAVVALQRDLPAEAEPFAGLAEAVGLSADRLLELGRGFLEEGLCRRYGAVLHHRRAGLAANVLVAWRVGEADADAAGRIAAGRAGVSHCFLREPVEGWPYSLYTMVHGRSRQECALVVDEIIAATGLRHHIMLWTTAEYKKARVRYFDDGTEQWEAQHAER